MGALISSPENLRNIDKYKSIAGKLAAEAKTKELTDLEAYKLDTLAQSVTDGLVKK